MALRIYAACGCSRSGVEGCIARRSVPAIEMIGVTREYPHPNRGNVGPVDRVARTVRQTTTNLAAWFEHNEFELSGSQAVDVQGSRCACDPAPYDCDPRPAAQCGRIGIVGSPTHACPIARSSDSRRNER